MNAEYESVKAVLSDASLVEKCDVPERDDFVRVYSEIKNMESEKVDFRVFALCFPEFSYVKLAVTLKALYQAGITDIEYDPTRPLLMKIRLNKVDGKCDLAQTPIMKELSEK